MAFLDSISRFHSNDLRVNWRQVGAKGIRLGLGRLPGTSGTAKHWARGSRGSRGSRGARHVVQVPQPRRGARAAEELREGGGGAK